DRWRDDLDTGALRIGARTHVHGTLQSAVDVERTAGCAPESLHRRDRLHSADPQAADRDPWLKRTIWLNLPFQCYPKLGHCSCWERYQCARVILALRPASWAPLCSRKLPPRRSRATALARQLRRRNCPSSFPFCPTDAVFRPEAAMPLRAPRSMPVPAPLVTATSSKAIRPKASAVTSYWGVAAHWRAKNRAKPWKATRPLARRYLIM